MTSPMPEGDVLSDHVYAYDRENERFYQVETREVIRESNDKEISGFADRGATDNVYASYADEVLASDELDR
ncbi:MAG: hypothetical protein ACLTQG_30460 [Hungatella sp.]|uniref:hypothetical protein n=1 Tax=Hungatella sp. TaxID=2613924 RepID=UPI0039954B45